jgi:hypothetical protein
MIYHLSSQTAISRQKFSKETWMRVLSLGIFYGWHPMGTRVPSMTEIHGYHTEYWDGTYLTNDGQIVVADFLWRGPWRRLLTIFQISTWSMFLASGASSTSSSILRVTEKSSS